MRGYRPHRATEQALGHARDVHALEPLKEFPVEEVLDRSAYGVEQLKLYDVLDELLKSKKNLIVNPFSKEDLSFFVPYEATERMLIPAMKK